MLAGCTDDLTDVPELDIVGGCNVGLSRFSAILLRQSDNENDLEACCDVRGENLMEEIKRRIDMRSSFVVCHIRLYF